MYGFGIKDIQNGMQNILPLIDQILCRLRNIEYYSMRSAIPNIGSIEKIIPVDVSTSPTLLYESTNFDTVVRVYNVTFSSPQILFVNHNKSTTGIPINTGEYESFFLREYRQLYGFYESANAQAIIAIMTI